MQSNFRPIRNKLNNDALRKLALCMMRIHTRFIYLFFADTKSVRHRKCVVSDTKESRNFLQFLTLLALVKFSVMGLKSAIIGAFISMLST